MSRTILCFEKVPLGCRLLYVLYVYFSFCQ